MKTTTFTFLLLLSLCQWLAAQCPTGDITFSTQGQVDSFQVNYPGCTDIPGSVNIQGTDIANLNGLTGVVSIAGGLVIGGGYSSGYNPSLTNLSGLDSLVSLGGLSIAKNDALESLHGLDNLAIVGGLTIANNDVLSDISSLKKLTAIPGQLSIGYAIYGGPSAGQQFGNAALTSLAGLDNIESVGTLQIIGNDSLSSLADLESLASIGNLTISGNPSLTSLTGLEHIDSIPGNLSIGISGDLWDLVPTIGNEGLTDLAGLDSITHVGSLEIAGNTNLVSLNGLDNLASIEGSINLNENYLLTDLSQLEQITDLPGNLTLYINNSLPDLTGFKNLGSIGGNLKIGIEGLGVEFSGAGNAALESLTGLENITSIEGNLVIWRNNSLQTLCGLNPELSIGGSFDVMHNPLLSACHVEAICNYLDNPPGNISIGDNAAGCKTLTQIESACSNDFADCDLTGASFVTKEKSLLMLYPNPATDFINLHFPNPFYKTLQVSLFDSQGRLVSQQSITNNQAMEVSHLPYGIYLLKASNDNQVFTAKFVK